MDENDIRDVMAEEKARGKKRLDSEARRAHRKLVRDLRYLLHLKDRNEFIENLLRLGLKPGSPRYELALQAWHENEASRRRDESS